MKFIHQIECLLCEGWSWAEPPLCSICWANFRAHLYRSQWRTIESSLEFLSLMTWDHRFPQAARGLLHAFKDANDIGVFMPFARMALAQIPLEMLQGAVFVSIPSSTGRRHSSLLARALAQASARPYLEGVLALTQSTRQVGVPRKDRLQREMYLVNERQLQNYRDVVLVDDVVVTGASLLAAEKAFKVLRTPLLCIWALALAYRAPSTRIA